MQFWYQNFAGGHYVMITHSRYKVRILCKMPAFTETCNSIVSVCFSCIRVLVVKYRVAQKWHIFVGLIPSSNIDQFSNFFSLSESGENL